MNSFYIIIVSMKLWNKLSNYIKVMSFVTFKVYIKTMLINMYCMTLLCKYVYHVVILVTYSIQCSKFSRKL